MDIVNVFEKIVDEEVYVRLVEVFGWLCQIVRFVRLRFKRSVFLTEEICAESALRERLLRGEDVLDKRVRAADCARDARGIGAGIEAAQLHSLHADGNARRIFLQ